MNDRATALDRTARLFVSLPNRWLTMLDLVQVGGMGGWRTRISDCRRQYGMRFEHRLTRDADGHVLRSEYRMVDQGWYPQRKPAPKVAA